MTIKELSAYEENNILPLYASVGWKNYTDRPDLLKEAYKRSLLALGAYDGEKLVGVLRAVGDGVSVVLIQDLLVLPAYQRQGIGTQLLCSLRKRFAAVYQMELMTDNQPGNISFYRANGFVQAEDMGCCAFLMMQV